MSRKINKVVRIGLGGGLIGLLMTNTKIAFTKAISEANADGWNLTEIVPLGGLNIFMLIIRLLILVLTLGLYTMGGNYILVFEKEA